MDKNLVQKKNILFGLTFKTIGIGLNFILVPLYLLFLGKEDYGIWITVFSMVNWIFNFDIGIGHGLRNKLTEAYSMRDFKRASSIISTSYILVSFFGLLIFISGVLLILNLDFQRILNYTEDGNSSLQVFLFLALSFTVFNFILNLYKTLYLSIHKSYVVELVNCIFLTIYVILINCWVYFDFNKDLNNLMIMHGFVSIIIAVIATTFFFILTNNSSLTYPLFDRKIAKSLFGLGGNFFLINISLLVILSTDNIIISNFLGPSQVTDYSVIQKIFQLLIFGFSVVLASSWGLYTEAIVKKDFKWIIENLKKMRILFIGLCLIGLVLYFSIEIILELWLGRNIIVIPNGLVELNLIYSLLFCFINIYMYFVNATGKIKLQMYLYIFGALINIPLSIYFINLFGTSSGVILSTIICTLPLLIAMPLQSKNILKTLQQQI